jgi:hypothetical protein
MRLLRAAVFAAVCVVLAAAGHSLASGRTVPAWSLALGWSAVFAVVAPLAGRERTLPGIAALLAVGQLALHAVFSTGQMCGALGGLGASRAGGVDGDLMAVAERLVCGGGREVALTPQAAREVVARAGLGTATQSMPSMPSMPSMSSTTYAPLLPSPHGAPSMTMHGGAGAGVRALLAMCTPSMLLGHLLAALAAGWLLRRGEAALWRLVRLSVRGASELAALPPAGLRLAIALLAALSAAAPYAWVRVRCVTGGPAARPRAVRLRHSLARRGPPAFALAA